MVYVDALFHTTPKRGWPYKYACHMVADSVEELHRFAALLGMKREWFQDKAGCPHYDLTAGNRTKAIRLGAKECSRREFVEVMRTVKKGTTPDDR